MLLDEGAFTIGGVHLEERGTLIVEGASFFGWELIPIVVACSYVVEGVIESEGHTYLGGGRIYGGGAHLLGGEPHS